MRPWLTNRGSQNIHRNYSLRQKLLGHFYPTLFFFFTSRPSPRPPNVVYRSYLTKSFTPTLGGQKDRHKVFQQFWLRLAVGKYQTNTNIFLADSDAVMRSSRAQMQVGVGVPDDEHEELGAPFYCSSISIYSLSSHFLISRMRNSIFDLEYSGLSH